MPKLVFRPGTSQAQEFELKPGKNFVGRGFANDFKLDDGSVSSSHALFEVNGSAVTITDLGSTNGTRVNGLPATGSPLQSGNILKLGGVELLYLAETTAANPGPTPPPPTAAAAQIATEFIIRDPSRVGVAPPAPPPAPAPAGGELRIPGMTPAAPPPPPPPVPITTAPTPVAQASGLSIPKAASTPPPAPPPPAPIVAAPAPIPQPAGLSIPGNAPGAPPRPAPSPVITAPVPVPQSSVTSVPPPPPAALPPPPPAPILATLAAEAPLPAGGLKFSNISHAPPSAPVTAPAPAPARQPAAAPAVPAGLMEAPGGKTVCKFHKNTPGQWFCQKCDQLFCSLCVGSQPGPTGVGYFCRACGTQCVQVKMKVTAKKEKKIAAYSDGTVLLRTVGFGLGGAVAGAGLWTGFAALAGFDMPAIFAPVVGVICGFAVKIASQDRPGGFFSIMAIVAMLLGVAMGMGGAVLVTHHLIFSINSLAIAVFGLVLGIFLAWKVGGGDF